MEDIGDRVMTDYSGIDWSLPHDVGFKPDDEEQCHVLRLSREGKVDEMRSILSQRDQYRHVSWSDAMIEAAFSTSTPETVRKEMLWELSVKLAGSHEDRVMFTEHFFDLGNASTLGCAQGSTFGRWAETCAARGGCAATPSTHEANGWGCRC